MTRLNTHQPPFPWFGGKSSVADRVWNALLPAILRICRARPSHKVSICQSFLFGIAGGCRNDYMTRLAFCFQFIRGSRVLVKIGSVFLFSATRAFFCLSNWPVSEFIFHVFGGSIPSQIIESVIGFVLVWIMAAMITLWAWANEGFKNYSMDLSCENMTIQIERDKQISGPIGMQRHFAWLSDTSEASVIAPFSFQAPDCSVASSKIIRKSRYWLEYIFHAFILPKPTKKEKA